LNPVAVKGAQAFIDIGVPEDYALAQTLVPTLAAKHPDDRPRAVS
jgi:hypothetical protein